MASSASSDPRYPLGKFVSSDAYSPHDLQASIAILGALPENLRAAVDGLSRTQIDTPYREGGWTVRQLVHHVADSHMNAYCRLRQSLTEDWPLVMAYDENRWAELSDARSLPVDISLEILEPVHRRWAALLESLTPEQWECGYNHSEGGRTSVVTMTAMYDWHSRHHVAHITQLRKNRGW